MEFRVLGPLEVSSEGGLLDLGGAKQRAVLTLLLLHANEVVPIDRLIDELWGDSPPESAALDWLGSRWWNCLSSLLRPTKKSQLRRWLGRAATWPCEAPREASRASDRFGSRLAAAPLSSNGAPSELRRQSRRSNSGSPAGA